MNLTPKQEKFCQQYILNGGNASNAYRSAYDAGRMKPATIWRKANELLNNGKVTARVEQLRDEINAQAIADIAERQKFWTDIMRSPAEDTKDRLKASELLARSQGDFIERREISGAGRGPVIVNIQHVAPPEVSE